MKQIGRVLVIQAFALVGVVSTLSAAEVGQYADGSYDMAIQDCYDRNGGQRKLGLPDSTNNNGFVAFEQEGVFQRFSGGSEGINTCVRRTESREAFHLTGAIRDAFLKQGGSYGTLGYPIADEVQDNKGNLVSQQFENGKIVKDSTGAFVAVMDFSPTESSPLPSPIASASPSASPTPSTIGSTDFPISFDADGYTTLTPSKDSRIIYVSATGNDNNDGLSPSRPIQTPYKAFGKIRQGMPDWIAFKSGDKWNSSIGSPGTLIGRSAAEPMVITRYGAGERPEFTISNSKQVGLELLGTVKYLMIEGIHIKGKAFYDSNVKESRALRIQVGSGNNILIENCVFEKTNEGLAISDGKGYKDVTLKRNIIADMTPNGSGWAGRVAGIYSSAVTNLNLIENVFDQNGYIAGQPGTYRTVFSHNAYIADTVYNLVARGNIFSRGSSDGLKMRRGGLAEENFFVQNAVGISINDYKITGVSTTARNNVFVDGSIQKLYDYSSTAQTRNYGFWAPYTSGATIYDTNNIFADSEIGLQGSTAFSDQGSTSRNIIWNWGKSADSSGSFKDPNRTLERYHLSIGGSGNKYDFFEEMRDQSRENYKSEYSAAKINAFFREGFQK